METRDGIELAIVCDGLIVERINFSGWAIKYAKDPAVACSLTGEINEALNRAQAKGEFIFEEDA